MQILSYSLNNLDDGAHSLHGFVVDDDRDAREHREAHRAARQADRAALSGSEILHDLTVTRRSRPCSSDPCSGGILGRLFREFAVTITAAISCQVWSITLTPMLCSRFLRVVHAKKGLAGLLDRSFDKLFDGYKWSLGLVLRHRIAMLVVFVAVLVATVEMYGIVPKGFIPDQDNDQMNINIRAAQGTSFYEMAAAGQRVAEIVRKNPYIDSFMVRTGGGGGYGSSNQAQLQINLVPRATRPQSAQQISQVLRRQLLAFPNYNVFVNMPSSLQIGARVGSSSYGFRSQREHGRALYAGSSAQCRDEGHPGNPGRVERSRDQEPESQSRDRSRQGGGRRAQRDPD